MKNRVRKGKIQIGGKKERERGIEEERERERERERGKEGKLEKDNYRQGER